MEQERALVVLRCAACGNTFSAHGADSICPSCGSDDVDLASEPLL